jgi:hypothetical protein
MTFGTSCQANLIDRYHKGILPIRIKSNRWAKEKIIEKK